MRADDEIIVERLKTVDGELETRFPVCAERTSLRALSIWSHREVSGAATTALISDAFAALDAPGADIGDRARRDWRYPAFWAPFTLVGEPG